LLSNRADHQVYDDGKYVKTKVFGSDKKLHFEQAVRLGFGGLNSSNKAFDQLPVKPFSGAMDEISIWTRPRNEGEIATLSK